MKNLKPALLVLSSILLGASLSGCTPFMNNSSSEPVSADTLAGSTSSTPAQTDYVINRTSATMTMGDELQLSITKGGSPVTSVTWSSSDTDLARVDSTGKVSAYFFTAQGEKVTITGKISKTKSLTCTLTIKQSKDSIFPKMYQDAEHVNQDENGHIIYSFVHAGTEAEGTLLVSKTFQYDSFTGICKIEVRKSYEEAGVTAYYIGKNTFYWGKYQEGLFYGQYSEVYNGTQKDAMFSFSNIGFSYSSHTILLQDSTTYKLEESDWSSITDESTVALGVFYRIQECSEFAEEKFQQHSFGIHLF